MNKFNIGDMVYIARISSGARRIMVWKKSFEIKGIKKDSTELKYLIDNEWESECNIYTDKDEVSAAVNKALNDLSDEDIAGIKEGLEDLKAGRVKEYE